MRCAACGTELLPGKRFCHACGARAPLVCAGCGASVSAEFRFCPDCGLAVAADGVHDAAPPPVDDPLARLSRRMPEGLARKIRSVGDAIEGERKQVTVLFCDLAGSTAIAERLDPEEYRALLEQYLELAFRDIYRFEGIVNHIAGDGVMALFGAPIAHEDAPQRAIRAALAIHDGLCVLNARGLAERGLALQARIGIHTGPVVVGTVGNDLKMDYTAVGDTTNLAARLESLATPGTTLVSEATHRLARGFFEVRPTGPRAVKGKSEPVEAYEVLGETATATPMAIAAARGLTPFVGREGELRQLEACFRRLEGRLAQVAAVVGDAGLGKSRLLYEFRRRLEGEPVFFFEARCSSLAAPYAPFVNMLKTHFGLVPGETTAAACEKVAARLGPWTEEAMCAYPALGRLLGLRSEPAGEASAEELKRETFDAVARLVLGQSRHGPVVVMLEDLHWIDDASRELLESLVARLGASPVMVLVTQRPDDRAGWRTRAAFTQLVLGRLADDDVRTIVRAVAGGPLPEGLERLVVGKAEGSPFCAEEITRSLLEEGDVVTNGGGWRLTRPIEEIRIPGTVQEVIAARLDRLGAPAKRVVQVASVLGRQFRCVELAELLAGEDVELERALAELEQRGIVHRKSALASDEYRFGESLTQEVAYEGLLLRQRRQLHERVGRMLETAPGEMTAERSALLAHHFARGDDRAKAVEALLRAGLQTEALPSYRTAVDFFRRTWEIAEAELANGGGDMDAFRHAALEATTGIARLCALFGAFPGVDARAAARRGRELAEALGDTETLANLCYFHGVLVMQGGEEEFARGLALAEEGMALAQRSGVRRAPLRISRGLAISYAHDGRFDLARRAIDWVGEELAREGLPPVSDLVLSTRWVRDAVLYMADELDAAAEDLVATYALAKRAPNHTVTGGSASTLAQVHFLRGAYAEALRWADESLEVGEAIGNLALFPGSAAVALAARHELGEPTHTERYLDLLEQGIAVGTTVQMHVRFLADGLRVVDDPDRIARLAGQLAACPAGGRLRELLAATALGELWARVGRLAEAERRFARAMALAEAIGHRSGLAAAALGAADVALRRGDGAAAERLRVRALALARALRLGRFLARAERLAEESLAASGPA